MDEILPSDYPALLSDLKSRIRSAQVRAALSVNREMVLLYWSMGRDILDRQREAGWGAGIIERLSQDLKLEFPTMKGFSTRNLKYMRAFAEAWPDESIVQQLVAQIPWGHNVRLLDHLDDPHLRAWYARKALENGWSRNVLEIQIERQLHVRQGAATTNFATSLPALQSDLARELIKDPYKLDFLGVGDEAEERQIEDALVRHIQQFLLELGIGFAFVGRQYKIEVGGDEFYIDLLFYHLRLRCYVVIELKAGKFKPEYAGKVNFYLSAVDELMRHADDNPSIGLILCKQKNAIVAEYSLRNITKPVGVSRFDLAHSLPAELEGVLPSIERLEHELSEVPE